MGVNMINFTKQMEQIKELEEYFNSLNVWDLKNNELKTLKVLLAEILGEIGELAMVVSDKIIDVQDRLYKYNEV